MRNGVMPTVTSQPPSASPVRPLWSGLLSLFFWLCLLIAAALYAGVSLAPKYIAWEAWNRQYQTNQWELVGLEQRMSQLEQVVAALKDDPQFSAELARIEFDALVPGEEVIPVSDGLTYRPAAPVETAGTPATHSTPPWKPWISAFASDAELRTRALTVAAALVLLGFTFLHDSRTVTGR